MKDEKLFLLQKLPAVNYDNKIIYSNGNNDDIQQALKNATPKAVEMVRSIAPYFKRSSAYQTGEAIHSFIRKNLSYRKDPSGFQQIKLPNRYLTESGDCKSKSLFVFSILKALGYNPAYKLANYDATKGNIPSHVYIILNDKGKKITIDGTYQYYNKEPKTFYSKIMEIQELSANLSARKFSKIRKLSSAQKATVRKNLLKNKAAQRKFMTMQPKAQQMFLSAIEADIDTIDGPKLKALAKKVTGKVKSVAKGAASTVKKVAAKTATVAKKGFQLGKTVGLNIPRNAFLALVALNVKSFATKLDKKKSEKLKKLWTSFGGDYTKLYAAIDKGKLKRPIGDNNESIGEPVTITLATAAPIIAKMVSFLGSEKGKALTKTAAALQKSKALATVSKVLKDNPALKEKLLSVGKEQAQNLLNKAVTSATGSSSAGAAAASVLPSLVPDQNFQQSKPEEFSEKKTFAPQQKEKPAESKSNLAKYILPLGIAAAALYAFKK
jgi:hypothetical protein